MATYRLGSSSLIHTPDIIAWAINGYAFPRDRARMVQVIAATFPTVPVRRRSSSNCFPRRSPTPSNLKPLCSAWRNDRHALPI